MKLTDIGYNSVLEEYRTANNLETFDVGRVISEHKERYIVKTPEEEFEGEILGNLRFTAKDRSDFPAVGDWVAISNYDVSKVLIHAIYPRTTVIERQAIGKYGEKQIIATNIDYAFIIQAVDRDFNINRLERYLTICNSAGVSPIIILNKIDLITDDILKEISSSVRERIPDIQILEISNLSGEGLESIKELIFTGKTYCLLGSSGAGKSSLINSLTGKQLMNTGSISSSNQKGRHITTHREMIVLPQGGIIIDNPGMREVGITGDGGLESTFEIISNLSEQCKFNDCTHRNEVGCAVIRAVEAGNLDIDSYENFLKMEREKDHFESTVAEKRQKDKDFGKMIKTFKKNSKYSK